MALVWFEHFDLYGGVRDNILARGYDGFVNSNSFLSTTSRTGTHSYQIGGNINVQLLGRTLPGTARSVAGIGCAIQLTSSGNTNSSGVGLRLLTTNGDFRAIINTDNGITLYRSGTVVATSSNNLLAVSSWGWVEMKLSAGVGSGSAEVKVNGTTVINESGLTVGDISHFYIGKNGSTPVTARFDDLIVWDNQGTINNDFMGDTFVLIANPTADTSVADWTPSSGVDRFAMIDETTPNDSDYIQATTLGQAAEFTHSALNLGVGSIAAIASQTRAFKSGPGAASYATGIKSGTASSMSQEIALATGAVYHTHIAEVNPDGNVPWTQSAANAARLRVERNA